MWYVFLLNYQEAPLLLLSVSEDILFLLGFLVDRTVLSASWLLPTILPYQFIVSVSPPSALSCWLLFCVKLLSFWTLMPAWMCTPRGPRHGVGFQISGPKGGFPFQNVWLINMSPGWKLIPWKTGGLFSNPPHKCVCELFLPSCALDGKECRSSGSRGIVCLEKASRGQFIPDLLLNLL